MHSIRRISFKRVLSFGLVTAVPSIVWAAAVWSVYHFAGFEWMAVPFQPLSVMGIAVAFYAGFKNNSAYDRFWEGRKIWGGVVNESRSWAINVLAHVRPHDDSPEAYEVRRQLIYRHLAWINALRLQLRSTSRFFDKPARVTRIRLEKHADHMRNDWEKELRPLLSAEEYDAYTPMANTATHLVSRQGLQLAEELRDDQVDKFHQIAMMEILRELFTLQGKAERIKKTPLPRQYAEYSRVFVRAFMLGVPFGLLDIFGDQLGPSVALAENWPWLISYLFAAGGIGWVFVTMEGVGDASEDPFERSMGDVPMNALCVVIERDLRQLLGEESIPAPEEPIDGILY